MRSTFEIDTVSRQLRARLCHDPGYLEVQRIPGVGLVLAAVFVAENGEADRFRDATHLVSWAGSYLDRWALGLVLSLV